MQATIRQTFQQNAVEGGRTHRFEEGETVDIVASSKWSATVHAKEIDGKTFFVPWYLIKEATP